MCQALYVSHSQWITVKWRSHSVLYWAYCSVSTTNMYGGWISVVIFTNAVQLHWMARVNANNPIWNVIFVVVSSEYYVHTHRNVLDIAVKKTRKFINSSKHFTLFLWFTLPYCSLFLLNILVLDCSYCALLYRHACYLRSRYQYSQDINSFFAVTNSWWVQSHQRSITSAVDLSWLAKWTIN